jgi:molybdate transport system substrate-binding protein
MAALHVISSMATRQLLNELVADFSRASSTPIQAEAAGGVAVAGRVRAGERFDLVVLADDALQSLAAEGWVQAPRIFADSSLAVAVPAGSPRPAIDTAEAFRAALTAAETIGYSTGPSGQALLQQLKDWGLHDALLPRLRQAPVGVPVAAMLASGEAGLGIQQRSELLGQPGIALLGSLPAGIDVRTRFSIALGRAAAPAAAGLRDFLCSGEATRTIVRHGMASAGPCAAQAHPGDRSSNAA